YRTGGLAGAVGLFVVRWSATVQPESSKAGAASGVSSWYRHDVRAGRVTGRGPPTVVWIPPWLWRAGDGRPFHRIARTAAGAKISTSVRSLVSPVSSISLPCTVAPRTKYGPRTSAGPAAVSTRQNVAADSSVASNRSSGVPPAG